MNNKESLLRRLSAAQFAVWEMHLFLDTHPCDAAAIEAYNNYYTRYKELLKEYAERFGEISPQTENGTHWQWVDSPWPWDNDFAKEEN